MIIDVLGNGDVAVSHVRAGSCVSGVNSFILDQFGEMFL